MLTRLLVQFFVVFPMFFFVSCVKSPVFTTYTEVLKIKDVVIAVPRGGDEKPVWKQAILTTSSMSRCHMGKTLPLPGGNRWHSKNGFFCLEGLRKDNLTFQEMRRKGWEFRWSCKKEEEGCVIR